MLFHLALYLQNFYPIFRVVHYISFRIITSLITVLLLSFMFGSKYIDTSKKLFRSQARDYTPETHQIKHGTPTMGGLFMILIITITALLWCNLTDIYIWLLLFTLISFGFIGFWDDLLKIKYRKGISKKSKFTAQILLAFIIAITWIYFINPSSNICLPIFKSYCPDIGIFLLPLTIFIIVGTSNAVNLTDGLDGLAITSLLPNFATFSIIAYLAGHVNFANYLHIPFTNTGEAAIFGAILVGASIGFLWYNTYPAQIFMGDVGSLSLGATLAFLAIITKQELLLAITGGLFVLEAFSVIIQVFSWKYFKKRVFKMAPIHHHFELIGWPETRITARFGIITFILCLIALVTLKVR